MSKWNSFSQGFLAGQRIADSIIEGRKRRELRDIADAAPEESQGFTADQGDELRAAAESGQYDIGIKTKEDGSFDRYVVTPKADPSQSGEVGMQRVTDFMGDRTAGSMSKEDLAAARQQARADVYKKYGDEDKASQLEQDAINRKRNARNDEWTQKTRARTEADWARQDQELEKKSEYEAGRTSLYESSNYVDVERSNAQAQSAFQAAMRAYEEAAKRGDTSAVKPAAPQLRRYGSAEALQDQLAGLALDTRYGKADFGKLAEVTKKIADMEDEGYTRALEVALNGGRPEQITGAFNATGSVHIKPESLKVAMGETTIRGAKVPTAFVTFTDEKTGATRTINAASEIAAYKGARSILDTQFAVNQDKRATNADRRAASAEARAATNFANDQRDTNALRAAQVELEQATQAGNTDAINAARVKVMQAGGKLSDGGSKDEPADLQMARAALQARVPGVKDMAGALEWVRTSKGKSMADVRADIYGKALAAKMGNAKEAQRETDAAMEYLFPQVTADDGAEAGGSSSGKAGSKPLASVSQKAVGEAKGYLGEAKSQEDFNKRVQALKRQGWTDDQIRALAR